MTVGNITDSDLEAVERVAGMQAVYRMYNAAGRLLYVGVTGNLTSRLSRHADKRWFPLVSTIKLEWFLSRDLAEAAEADAIRDERPQINIAGVPSAVRNARISRPAPTALPAVVTLTEAIEAGVFKDKTLSAVRKARSRDDGFPKPVGERRGSGLPGLVYNVSDLYTYDQNRQDRRERQAS